MCTYSGELRFKPSVVRSIPGANAMRLWSFSLAALMKVNRPAIPNWSVTIPDGILDTMPVNSRSKKYQSCYGKTC